MLDLWLEHAAQKEKTAGQARKFAEALESLPLSELLAITKGESPLNKLGHYGDGEACWLDQFQGSPLYDQALAIEKRKLELDMSETADRAQRDAARRGTDVERDTLNVQRRMLELELAEQKHRGAGEAPAGAAPEVAADPNQLPAPEGGMSNQMSQPSAAKVAAKTDKLSPEEIATEYDLGGMPAEQVAAMANDLRNRAGDVDANPTKYRLMRGAVGGAGGALVGGLIGSLINRGGPHSFSSYGPHGAAIGGGLGALASALPKPTGDWMRNDAESLEQHMREHGAKTAAELTEAARDKIKPKNFALSAKQSDTGKPAYPIEDKRHAANALSRVGQFGTSSEKAEVYKDVARKYPELARKSDVSAVREKAKKASVSDAAALAGLLGAAHGANRAQKADMPVGNPTLFGALGAAGGQSLGGITGRAIAHETGASYPLLDVLGRVGGGYLGYRAGTHAAGVPQKEKEKVKKADSAHIANLIQQTLQGAGKVAPKLNPGMYSHIQDAAKSVPGHFNIKSLAGGGHPALSGGMGAKLAEDRFRTGLQKIALGINFMQAAKNIGQLGLHAAKQNPAAAMALGGAGLGALAAGKGHRMQGALAGGALGGAAGYAAPKMMTGMQQGLSFGQAAKATGQMGLDQAKSMAGNAISQFMPNKAPSPGLAPAAPSRQNMATVAMPVG